MKVKTYHTPEQLSDLCNDCCEHIPTGKAECEKCAVKYLKEGEYDHDGR